MHVSLKIKFGMHVYEVFFFNFFDYFFFSNLNKLLYLLPKKNSIILYISSLTVFFVSFSQFFLSHK